MIYFDHAASSWPKPDGVAQAMAEAIEEYGANPGRGGHQLANKASEVIYKTRKLLALLFRIQDPNRIVFYPNATGALNQAIKGFDWESGDQIIATMYEHNSVRRPLEFVRREYGVDVLYIQPDHNGDIHLEELEKQINQKTKLIVTTHVSNLTGAILPIADIGKVAHQFHIPYLVDASQSAGILPIDVGAMYIDLLAFPGHKGLLGPQGTGGLYLSPKMTLKPLLHGGTGSHSEGADQPQDSPQRYEAGTLNTPGIAGLHAGLSFLLKEGIEEIEKHEQELTQYALQRLSTIKGVRLYGPDVDKRRAAVIALNLEGVDPQELASILDQHYGIATRAGLHCTPLAHQSIQTEENGTLRISFGYYNRTEEVDQLLTALEEIRIGFLGE